MGHEAIIVGGATIIGFAVGYILGYQLGRRDERDDTARTVSALLGVGAAAAKITDGKVDWHWIETRLRKVPGVRE